MWDSLIITPFINVLLFIYNLVGQNFGIAIILFTILIRLITYPLNASQVKASQSMQKLNSDKRWIDAQEKYKNDKERLAQEQMKLYKELGINPFASCLPTLIQFPIIIGLYQSLLQAMASSPLDLVKLIGHIYPGWMDVGALIPMHSQFLWFDLGSPERLFLPFLPAVGIPVLAVLVVVTTYLQQKLMTPPSTGSKDQSSQMMGMMNIYMPLLMGWLAWTLQGGLAVYFVTSNLFGIAQYALMGRLNWRNLLPKEKKEKPTIQAGK
ncbi:MAG TPA: YidC/Oxa1 family membrane protein insertase [Longilinea sp.]|nr:YidC/Oxa1 family membrane protein insertase [Longilinea sp.]